MNDAFIKMYIDDVLHNIRVQVLLRVIKPYKRIGMLSLSKQLGVGVTEGEVEDLLVELILDGKLCGRIDQVNMVYHLDGSRKDTPAESEDGVGSEVVVNRYEAMDKWLSSLSDQHKV